MKYSEALDSKEAILSYDKKYKILKLLTRQVNSSFSIRKQCLLLKLIQYTTELTFFTNILTLIKDIHA